MSGQNTLNRVRDPLLHFNLNTWTIVLVAMVLIQLAAFSAATTAKR